MLPGSSHAHSKLSEITAGTCIRFEEEVYVYRSCKPNLLGLRENIGEVMDGEGDKRRIKILKSSGHNALPAGTVIERSPANVINGSIVDPQHFKSGGTIQPGGGADGGYLSGPKHSDGGIPGVNKSTGQHIEVEGGEVIITAPAVEDNKKREFEGEMLTNRQILSRINQSGGGVSFEDGGEIKSCKCSGKSFRYGGAMLTDYDIIGQMNSGG